MCGIAGIFSKSSLPSGYKLRLEKALKKMKYRGPDHTAVSGFENILLGHTRLSIIDTSNEANQPMAASDGNYNLVFNGEIFNFPELKSELIKSGVSFSTHSDTEVLLQLLIRDGIHCLKKLNGFFAFAFYDRKKNEVLLARDRFGEKPLKYSFLNDQLIFASEITAIADFLPYKKLNQEALHLYFQFNYIPAPLTIYKDIYKLMPGEYIRFSPSIYEKAYYYQLPDTEYITDKNSIKKQLNDLLHDAVKRRLITDVPLGSFLSGGIDSTIISGIAREYDKNLSTFSIGFPDDRHFDETPYALEASKFLNTSHQVFNVRSKTLLDNFEEIIDRMDEPFADSSALAVFELTRQTRSEITVALSGDGADELFAGYHKHLAHHRSSRKNITNALLKQSSFLFSGIKGSRNNRTSDKIRQVKKYTEALKLSPRERYLRWASFLSAQQLNSLFIGSNIQTGAFLESYLKNFKTGRDLNEVLRSDIELVLANDMLVKVDLMSMANSLEVRPPFLDYRIVELSLKIPSEFKITNSSKKHILKETFVKYIPKELVNRRKKGFEVPLHAWFNKELKGRLEQEWLNENFIRSQGLFNTDFIAKMKKAVFSKNPGDSSATTWAMIVFQEWIKKNKMEL